MGSYRAQSELTVTYMYPMQCMLVKPLRNESSGMMDEMKGEKSNENELKRLLDYWTTRGALALRGCHALNLTMPLYLPVMPLDTPMVDRSIPPVSTTPHRAYVFDTPNKFL